MGNPWGLSFMRMFDMANDSGLFSTAAQLRGAGFVRDGTDCTLPEGLTPPQRALDLAGGRDGSSLTLEGGLHLTVFGGLIAAATIAGIWLTGGNEMRRRRRALKRARITFKGRWATIESCQILARRRPQWNPIDATFHTVC
jgi:hypothetical protein